MQGQQLAMNSEPKPHIEMGDCMAIEFSKSGSHAREGWWIIQD